MYSEFMAAITSSKSLLDVAKVANGMANFNELITAVSDVNAKLLDSVAVALASQAEQTALIEQVNARQEKIKRPEVWDTLALDYTLKAVGVHKTHLLRFTQLKQKLKGLAAGLVQRAFKRKHFTFLSFMGNLAIDAQTLEQKLVQLFQVVRWHQLNQRTYRVIQSGQGTQLTINFREISCN